MHLVTKGGETHCVKSLAGYKDWTILKSGPGAEPTDEAAQFVGGAWIIPLPILRSRKIDAAKVLMDQIRAAGMQAPYGRFDVDHRSQSSLSSALVAAGNDYSQAWTLFDNTSVTLNLAMLRDVCVRAQALESGLKQRMQALRSALAACETAAAIAAVQF